MGQPWSRSPARRRAAGGQRRGEDRDGAAAVDGSSDAQEAPELGEQTATARTAARLSDRGPAKVQAIGAERTGVERSPRPQREGRVAVATYIALIDWTDQGVQNFKDSVDRYETAQSQMRSMGVELTNIYWTLGVHDIVSVVEAPDDQALAAALLAVAGQGNIRTTTLRAF